MTLVSGQHIHCDGGIYYYYQAYDFVLWIHTHASALS